MKIWVTVKSLLSDFSDSLLLACYAFREQSKVPGTQKQWEQERQKYIGENTESQT